jgi:hypothetical protein
MPDPKRREFIALGRWGRFAARGQGEARARAAGLNPDNRPLKH